MVLSSALWVLCVIKHTHLLILYSQTLADNVFVDVNYVKGCLLWQFRVIKLRYMFSCQLITAHVSNG